MPRSVLGLDIGGANLKAAHTAGSAGLQPFELWKNPGGLAGALRELIEPLPAFDLLAVTMTGELCDCFETKRQGINIILDAVQSIAGHIPVRVWGNDGRFVEVAEARASPLLTAAANWLALATFACRYAPAGPGLLLDIGSTTTDIVPLLDGSPIPRGRTDPQRLRCHELVYTGVRRTPLCALLGPGHAAEWFATTLDVYLTLGDMAEDAMDRATADGRPATRAAAHGRLARMICSDAETCSEEEGRAIALAAFREQANSIRTAVDEVVKGLIGPPGTVVLAGSGEFLARRILETIPGLSAVPVLSLAEELGPEKSQAACAHAIAVLAEKEGGEVKA